MKIEFYIIEIKIEEFDGIRYEYVTSVDINSISYNGCITVNTSSDPLKAIRFSDWGVNHEPENKRREQYINMVKSYFPKKNHQISYKLVTVTL